MAEASERTIQVLNDNKHLVEKVSYFDAEVTISRTLIKIKS